MSTRLHIVVSDELVARIDAALGPGQPRSDFIRRAVERAVDVPSVDRIIGRLEGRGIVGPACSEAAEQALSEAKGPTGLEQADPGSVPSSEGVRSAAPAEQPRDEIHWRPDSAEERLLGVRSSSQAKRDVRPVPKKGER